MPLQKQNIEILFTGALDQDTDPKAMQMPNLLRMENATQEKTGTLSKRDGYEQLGVNIGGANYHHDLYEASSIMARNDNLILLGRSWNNLTNTTDYDYNAYVWDGAGDYWQSLGMALPAELSLMSVGGASSSLTNTDVAITDYSATSNSGNHICYVYSDNDGYRCYAEIFDLATKTKIGDRIECGSDTVGGYQNARVISINFSGKDYFVVYTTRGTQLYYAVIDTTNIYAGAARSSGVAFNNVHSDYVIYNTNDTFCYKDSDKFLRIYTIDPLGVLSPYYFWDDYVIEESVEDAACIYKTPSDEVLAMFHDASGNIRWYRFSSSLGLLSGPHTLTTALQGYIIHNMTMVYEPRTAKMKVFIEASFQVDSAYQHQVWSFNFDADGTDAVVDDITYFVGLASRAFVWNDTAYIWCIHDSAFQPTYFLKSYVAPYWRTHAKILANAGGNVGSNALSAVVVTGDGEYTFAARRKERLLSDGEILESCVGAQASLGTTAVSNQQTRNNLLLGGGQILEIDSGGIAENGFHLYPEHLTLSTDTVYGNIADGTYSYKAVYEYTDRNGNIYRSAPSPAIEYVLSGGGGTARLCPQCELPQETPRAKAEQTKVHFYRTTNNGSIFYKTKVEFRVTDTTTPFLPGYTRGDLWDTLSDGDLVDNEVLYTDTGELENIAPPASNIVYSTQDRVLLIPADAPKQIWFSKPITKGTGVCFSDYLVLDTNIPEDITALGMLGYTLLVFTANSIYMVPYKAPNSQGVGTFGEIKLLKSDIGCIDRKSLVAVPNGMMFKSYKGIYLLDVSLSTVYIGAAVEDYNEYDITSALTVRELNQVRFALSDAQPTLVYDYMRNQWSEFSTHSIVDSCRWKNLHTWIHADGYVNVETPGVFADGSEHINYRIDTGWFKFSALQNYGRVYWVYLIGEYKSSHRLVVSVYYDYADSVSEEFTYTITTSDDPYQVCFKPAKQKCQAMRLRIQDDTQSGTGESMSITGIKFVVGVKQKTPIKSSKKLQ